MTIFSNWNCKMRDKEKPFLLLGLCPSSQTGSSDSANEYEWAKLFPFLTLYHKGSQEDFSKTALRHLCICDWVTGPYLWELGLHPERGGVQPCCFWLFLNTCPSRTLPESGLASVRACSMGIPILRFCSLSLDDLLLELIFLAEVIALGEVVTEPCIAESPGRPQQERLFAWGHHCTD